MLEHGGRLLEMAGRIGIPAARWLDLSTGINPRGYPVPALPAEAWHLAWHRLPEEEDGLAQVAADYYRAPPATTVLPIAGTQAAIQALPRVLAGAGAGAGVSAEAATKPLRVAVASLTYNEYAHAWRKAGHAVTVQPYAQLPNAATDADVVIVCQPNNPTGELIEPKQVAQMAYTLARRNGWLVIDEAYADAAPTTSVLPHIAATDWRRVIVLRSLGKFFGLAGARAGFAISTPEVIAALRDELGPWPLSGPARVVAAQALGDSAWQHDARLFLHNMAQRLDDCLTTRLGVAATGAALFRWCAFRQADALHEHLARAGILVRKFSAPSSATPGDAHSLPSLRFGLPANETQLARLDHALEKF